MSQQQRVVQLSAASLALVLGQDGESSTGAGGKCSGSSPSGQDIFADFKSQNLRSFWNKRLVRAVEEIVFQGWLENFVLLVQGSANNLEVLREAWMRRALRSPKGFAIRAVGDVSPVHMSPITQSQFIPLSEVLCCVISDMNAAHIVVNQEALISHMMKAHPGMSIPTQDILYSALGALIKERKIYHTGEGYFIVTPQTYFITNSPAKDKQRWITAETDPPLPPPITYLVSTESCVESAGDTVPVVAHCKSCRCFAQQPAQPVHDQQSISECTGRSFRWAKESKPTIQHQSTSTAADYQPSEASKSTATRRDKEKTGRKFGLSLFRRNTAKKEKPKKEYATFSAQFPPEEWPVRDEDDLNNLPRDLELAIIKRINPELTVDNLVRHTVMMKKLEERGINKGISTEILGPRHRHHLKGHNRRSSSKAARLRKRGLPSREKHRTKNKSSVSNTELEGVQEAEAIKEKVPCHLNPEMPVDELDAKIYEDLVTVESKHIYKKRIDNPFQDRAVRDSGLETGPRAQKKRDSKGQRSERRERTAHRSKSWDSSRAKALVDEDRRAPDDRSCENIKPKGFNYDAAVDTSPQEYAGDYGSSYPESSTLRIEDKWKQHVKDVKPKGSGYYAAQEKESKYKVLQDGCIENSLSTKHLSRQTEAADLLPSHSFPPQVTYHCDTATVPSSWPMPNNQHQLSVALKQLDSTDDRNQKPDLQTTHSQLNSAKGGLSSKSNGLRTASGHMDSEGFTDDDQAVYQQAVEDDDGCSSLYLNEDSDLDSNEASRSGTVHYHKPFSKRDDWNSTGVEEGSVGAQQEHAEVFGTHCEEDDLRWHESGSQHPAKPKNIMQTDNGRRMSPFLYEHLEDAVQDVEQMETVDSSIFDYCHTSEADSDAETLHKSSDEGDDKSSLWTCDQHVEESLRKQFEQKLELVGTSHTTVTSPNAQGRPVPGETVENHSITGDSGIDSPRTRVSLASNNSVILEGLKRRSFLQNLEKLHSKSNVIRPQSSLLQLTPVMNV
ncbi:storkhead-box protein 1 [Lepisosteus oculatus]|uniref:storkhead-box protein 1 n=1 Tax=Lepisosteus oculatus TaxID=7918 RepID=UPI00371A66F3